jgi:Domain of unknown function (DUF4331)
MSDHISGPRALADPIADITDLYAFPSPERPGRLVLVLNTLPMAPRSARFSEGLLYRFRVKPLVPTPGPGNGWQFGLGDRELTLDCAFSTPDEGGMQRGECVTSTGEAVSFRVDDTQNGSGQGLRVFAGQRWDPFIMDARAALTTIATRTLAFSDRGSIFLDGKNVLSIVVEVDSDLLAGWQLVGVVAETLTRGACNVRIERVGRPEVKNMMLAPKDFDQVNRDLEIRDLYNMEDAFCLGDSYQGAYRARLDANLAFWDSMDGHVDWPIGADGHHPLTESVLADYLVVDVTKPYREHGSFLEIELATRHEQEHETCGGRTLNDDVMDLLFTLMVNAGNGPTVSDGVDAASRPATVDFPYLAPPNPDPPLPPEHH